MRAVPVGIIEAQRLFAPFLSQLLSEAGFTVVTSMDSVSIEELGRTEPSVVLIDTDYVEDDALTALRKLRAVLPEAAICAYTGTLETEWALRSLRAGANCILSKMAEPHEIVDGIRAALREGEFIDPRFGVGPE